MSILKYEDYEQYFYNYDWNLTQHEKDTWDYLKELLKNYDNFVFLDIGAQKGIYSEKILQNFKNCHVYGFDVLKHPEIKHLEKSENFTFINKAIGNGKNISAKISYNNNIIVKNIESIELDSLKFKHKKLFLKIDVDGNEFKILNNSKKIFGNYDCDLFVEIENPFKYLFCCIFLGFYNLNYINSRNDINHFFLSSNPKVKKKFYLKTFKKLFIRMYLK